MKRHPVQQRLVPDYPDRRRSHWAVGVLAIGSALSAGTLLGCETPAEPSPHVEGVNALPGEMPAVDGDMHVADPDVPPDVLPDPVIPEAEEGSVEIVEIEGDIAMPHPEPIPGGMRAPGHLQVTPVDAQPVQPMPGEPVAPSELEPAPE